MQPWIRRAVGVTVLGGSIWLTGTAAASAQENAVLEEHSRADITATVGLHGDDDRDARAGLKVDDVDVLELNEAFAAQALAVLRGLGLPDDAEHVNPHGGAIALGHPLGMSGARLALSSALELADRGARRAVVTMCIGVGQGIAVLLEAP